MTLHVNDEATWRTIVGVYVNDSGTWRTIEEVYVNDGGIWRSIFVNDVVALESVYESDVFELSAPSIALFSLQNDGDIAINNATGDLTDTGDWLTPKNNMADYEARATVLSGSLSTGVTGAWLNLGTTRTWTLNSPASGVSNASFTIEIRRASDSEVLATATVNLEAELP